MVPEVIEYLKNQTETLNIQTAKSLADTRNNNLLLLEYVSKMYDTQIDEISWHDVVFTEDEYTFVDTTNNKIENANKNVKTEFRKKHHFGNTTVPISNLPFTQLNTLNITFNPVSI